MLPQHCRQGLSFHGWSKQRGSGLMGYLVLCRVEEWAWSHGHGFFTPPHTSLVVEEEAGRPRSRPCRALGVQEERRGWQGVTAVAGHASLWCCLRPLTELVSPVRPMRRKEGSPISQMLLCCLLRRGSKELKKEIFNNPPQLQ